VSNAQQTLISTRRRGIEHVSTAAMIEIPRGHVGEFVIPGTGRRVWWTGRVAIGLRHQPERYFEPLGRSALWIQDLMLTKNQQAAKA
jgi:hypothetical protein